MELIKEIERRRDKDGTIRKWGKFWCDYCKSEVEKRLRGGKLSKSCGCVHYKLASEAKTGKKRKPFTKEHRNNMSNSAKGRTVWNKGLTNIYSEETLQKMSKSHSENQFGENNPNWNNGSSFEIYPQEFYVIRESILERDNYTCQCPDCEHKACVLDIHHIDYDKKNNIPENLITLCNSCHSKTNGKNNRPFWTEFYQNILINRIIECLL